MSSLGVDVLRVGDLCGVKTQMEAQGNRVGARKVVEKRYLRCI